MSKPTKLYHKIFLVLAIVFVVIYLFFILQNRDSNLDINIHDTYFVIAHVHILQLLALWFGLCSLGYYIVFRFDVKLFNWLFWLHLIYSLLLFLNYPLEFIRPEPFIEHVEFYQFIETTEFIFILAFPFGQLVYFLNILYRRSG